MSKTIGLYLTRSGKEAIRLIESISSTTGVKSYRWTGIYGAGSGGSLASYLAMINHYMQTKRGLQVVIDAHAHQPSQSESAMLNDLSLYEDAGRKAGRASRHHDVGTVEFHSRWMRGAIALERLENRPAARKAFDDAYRAEATPTPVLG